MWELVLFCELCCVRNIMCFLLAAAACLVDCNFHWTTCYMRYHIIITHGIGVLFYWVLLSVRPSVRPSVYLSVLSFCLSVGVVQELHSMFVDMAVLIQEQVGVHICSSSSTVHSPVVQTNISLSNWSIHLNVSLSVWLTIIYPFWLNTISNFLLLSWLCGSNMSKCFFCSSGVGHFETFLHHVHWKHG